MKLKNELQMKNEILDALTNKDKKELKKTSYVVYNDIIEFPQPVAFKIKRLKEIIGDVERTKLKGNNLMVGLMIEIPIPEELKGLKRKVKGVKSVKKIHRNLK